jgi:hypothetical protein
VKAAIGLSRQDAYCLERHHDALFLRITAYVLCRQQPFADSLKDDRCFGIPLVLLMNISDRFRNFGPSNAVTAGISLPSASQVPAGRPRGKRRQWSFCNVVRVVSTVDSQPLEDAIGQITYAIVDVIGRIRRIRKKSSVA